MTNLPPFPAAAWLSRLLLLALSLASNIKFTHAGTPDSLARQSVLLFIENRGQVLDQLGHNRTDVLFTSHSNGIKVAIFADGISYQFERYNGAAKAPNLFSWAKAGELPAPAPVETYRLDVRLVGANPHPVIQRGDADPYYENYYNLPGRPDGITGVRAYCRVVLQEVYPGIDWVLYTRGNSLKYDFIVHPGADPNQIQLEYQGAVSMELQPDGSLSVETPLGYLREEPPVSFCGARTVMTSYQLTKNQLHYSLEAYDKTLPLTIDPALLWGTYYGGSDYDTGTTTTLGRSGNVYLAGFTGSTTNIATGGHQNTYGGVQDAFLVKFDSSGVRLWATYYGGSSYDNGYSTAVDGLGNIYLAGGTYSATDIASGGHQNAYGGGGDAFLVKFDSNGLRVWATYYGGSSNETSYSTAVDGSGNVYLAGSTSSTMGISSGGHQNTFNGARDGFLVKFNSDGVRLWATYYGGSGDDISTSTAVDGSGNIYLAGWTASTTAMASVGHQNTYGGGSYDGYLVKFDSSGTRLWATYYGGSGGDFGLSTAVDGLGNAYLSGGTESTTGIASGGHQNTYGGAFLVKFDSNGVRLWATYYNGDFGLSTVVDGSGNVYLAGGTASVAGVASGGYQNTYGGGGDAFLVKFNSDGVRLWSTYYGGTGEDYGNSIAVDGSENVYLAGLTKSSTGIASGGFQNSFGGGDNDAFLAKFSNDPTTSVSISGSNLGFELYQNQPNPFVDRTMIGFHLPKAGTAMLSIFDQTGRLLYKKTGDFGYGYQAVWIDRSQVLTTGLLYYQLEMGGYRATKKMIIGR